MSVQTFDPDNKISMTKAATEYLRTQMADQEGAIGIRVSIKPSGCSGYMYVLDVITKANDSDIKISPADDLDVYIDPDSLPVIRGTVIDLVQEGLNRSIKFINPNVTGECGCGESFTVN